MGKRKLGLAVAGELAGEDARGAKKLDASGRGFTHVEDLSPCTQLNRLDLSHNAMRHLEGIFYCKTLTWLNLSHNRLESLVGVQALTNLKVLNASHNIVTACGDLSPLKSLRALVLSNNQIAVLQGLSALRELNTLVLSQNCFKSISVQGLVRLTKLSLSHNSLRAIPDTQHNPELKELRVNDNKIRSISIGLQVNRRLTLLDVGNNCLSEMSDLEPLKGLQRLVNLNLRGNELCDLESYHREVFERVPSVSVLDGKKKLYHLSKTEEKEEEEEEEEKGEEGSEKLFSVAVETNKLKRKRDSSFEVELPSKRRHITSEDKRKSKKAKKKADLVEEEGRTDSGSGTPSTAKEKRTKTVKHKRKVEETTKVKRKLSSSSVTAAEDEGRLQLSERGGLLELNKKLDRKLKKSLTKKTASSKKAVREQSGVVMVKEIGRRRKRRKESEGERQSPSELFPCSDFGSGQNSSWT